MDKVAINAIDRAGGAVALCERINATVPGADLKIAAVRKWRENGVPARWAVICSELTGTPLAELRPDMVPPNVALGPSL